MSERAAVLSVAGRITRGRLAEDVLRLPVVHDAAVELNRRAFDLFISSGLDVYGDQSRDNARRMVHGAEAFLDILKEWVTEARELQEDKVDDHV